MYTIYFTTHTVHTHPAHSTIGLKPTDFTPTGVPQVSAAVLKKLAGKNLFGEGERLWYEFLCVGSTLCALRDGNPLLSVCALIALR